jgi:hypothetical protein
VSTPRGAKHVFETGQKGHVKHVNTTSVSTTRQAPAERSEVHYALRSALDKARLENAHLLL